MKKFLSGLKGFFKSSETNNSVLNQDQSVVESLDVCRKKAEQGDALAQFKLALRYVEGDGVIKKKSWRILFCHTPVQGLLDVPSLRGKRYIRNFRQTN